MIFGIVLVECITQCFTMFERVAAIVEAALGMQRSLLLVCCMTWWGSFQAGKGGELTHDETTIIAGALELTEKTASQAMTAIESVFSLDVTAKLDLYVRLSSDCKQFIVSGIVSIEAKNSLQLWQLREFCMFIFITSSSSVNFELYHINCW